MNVTLGYVSPPVWRSLDDGAAGQWGAFERALHAVAAAARGQYEDAERQVEQLAGSSDGHGRRQVGPGDAGVRLTIALVRLDRGDVAWAGKEFRRLAEFALDGLASGQYVVERLGELTRGLLATGQAELAVEVFRRACRAGVFASSEGSVAELQSMVEQLAASGLLEDTAGPISGPPDHMHNVAATIGAALLRSNRKEEALSLLQAFGRTGDRHEARRHTPLFRAARLLVSMRDTSCKYLLSEGSDELDTVCKLIPMVISVHHPQADELRGVLDALHRALGLEVEQETTAVNGDLAPLDAKLTRLEEKVDRITGLVPNLLHAWQDIARKLDDVSDELQKDMVWFRLLPELDSKLQKLFLDEGVDIDACKDSLRGFLSEDVWSRLSSDTQEFLANAEAVWRLGTRLSEWGGVPIYLCRALESELRSRFVDPLVSYVAELQWPSLVTAGKQRLDISQSGEFTLGNIEYILRTTSELETPNTQVLGFIRERLPEAQEFLLNELPSRLRPIRAQRNNGGHPGRVSFEEAREARAQIYRLLRQIVTILNQCP